MMVKGIPTNIKDHNSCQKGIKEDFSSSNSMNLGVEIQWASLAHLALGICYRFDFMLCSYAGLSQVIYSYIGNYLKGPLGLNAFQIQH